MDKVEGEEIAKIIKNIETDEDDEGLELILEKNETIQLKIQQYITWINEK